MAEAEASEVSLIKKSIGDECRAVDYVSAVQWLDALKGMSLNGGDNKVVFLPVSTMEGIADIIADPNKLQLGEMMNSITLPSESSTYLADEYLLCFILNEDIRR